MKIDNPLNTQIIPPNLQRERGQNNAVPQTINSDRLQTGQRSNPEIRELSNALEVMQKAQMIVQQALSISNRLKNIAAEGLNEGNIDYSQISNELSQASLAIEGLPPSMKTQFTPIGISLQSAGTAVNENNTELYEAELYKSNNQINQATESIVKRMGGKELSRNEAARLSAMPINKDQSPVQYGISPERVKNLIS